MNLRELFIKSVSLLKNFKFIENPELEASLIISNSLNIEPKDIIIDFDRKISKTKCEVIYRYIGKRSLGMSIASIIKKKEFYDLEFYVNENVLIPRPETELLIDAIKQNIDKNGSYNILDACTGSGNISVILAKYFSNSFIYSVDISKEAIKVARKNIYFYNLKDKIKLLTKDIFKFIPEIKYDIIVSNPPYIKSEIIKKLLISKSVSDPEISLDGGNSGLLFYKRLHYLFCNYTNNNSWIFMEHGKKQREKIVKLFRNDGQIFTYNDINNIDRVIVVKKGS
jgi:release factor glutamine methyltransferase